MTRAQHPTRLPRSGAGAIGAGWVLALGALASTACGAGLSDFDWARVLTVGFVPYPQAAEPGERVRTTLAFDVPGPGTRVVGIEVDPGLSYELYDTGSCDDSDQADEPADERLVLCLTLCVDSDADRGERAIRVKTVTGTNDDLLAVGTFFVLDRYHSDPGPCATES